MLDFTRLLHAFLYPSVIGVEAHAQRAGEHPPVDVRDVLRLGLERAAVTTPSERCDQMFWPSSGRPRPRGPSRVSSPNMQFHASLTARLDQRPPSCTRATACARGGRHPSTYHKLLPAPSRDGVLADEVRRPACRRTSGSVHRRHHGSRRSRTPRRARPSVRATSGEVNVREAHVAPSRRCPCQRPSCRPGPAAWSSERKGDADR